MRSYRTLSDQIGQTWHLTVDASAAHTGAVLTVLETPPEGVDLTPEAPSWLVLPGTAVSQWYAYPSLAGVPTVALIPPALGTGLNRPLGMALMDTWRTLWQLSVQEMGGGGGGGSLWVPVGWVPVGWIPMGTGGAPSTGVLVPVLMAEQATFAIGLPQGVGVHTIF